MKIHNINYSTTKNLNNCTTNKYSDKLTFLYICLVLSLYNCYSQNSNEVFSEYVIAEKNKNDSLINFHKDKRNNLKYLSLLPSINYDLDQGSFNLGISLSNYVRYVQTKNRNAIELERLQFQLDEKLDTQLEKYALELEEIKNEYQIHVLQTENFSISTDLYNLKKQQYENNKITLEDWLNIQNNYKNQEVVLLTRRMKLISQIKAFSLKSKSSCFGQELEYLINASTSIN